MSNDVDTLMEMGFPKNRAEKALFKTQYKSVQVAMDWLFSHGEDADIDDPFELPKGQLLGQSTEPGNTEGSSDGTAAENMETAADTAADGAGSSEQKDGQGEPQQANSLKCDDCGKLLKSPEAAELHAARTSHSNFSESTEEIKPLTEEEKKKQLEMLQDRIKQKRMEKEDQEKKDRIAREKMRRVHGKEVAASKEKIQELEMKKLMEERRRDKEEEKLARQRVREQIEKDKRDRAAKSSKSPQATAPASTPGAAASAAAVPQQKKDYDKARIQIRLMNGQALTQTFGVKEPLSAVRLYTEMNRTDGEGAFTFMTTFPRKVFSSSDMDAPLDSLGLVPSAVLIVTKQQ